MKRQCHCVSCEVTSEYTSDTFTHLRMQKVDISKTVILGMQVDVRMYDRPDASNMCNVNISMFAGTCVQTVACKVDISKTK